ncbi:MAG: cob(I)yrinic acid a,c-diamide adenosyltransferase [Prevotellaceae bacterium]|nr:cob(I)yrinic acid a,c-diamide adenosyltransferase [Prevotellaceae bacterium]
MAKKSSLYTRRGDLGETSLAGGRRVSKTNERLEAYGTLDELNSFIGLLMAHVSDEGNRQLLLRVQSDLFSIGSRLATEEADAPWLCSVTDEAVRELERAIDEADEQAGGWKGFVLPSGTEGAALAHVCRTVCRRLERRMYAIEGWQSLEPQLFSYVNRLSDYLFALARKLNHAAGVEEKMWRKRS